MEAQDEEEDCSNEVTLAALPPGWRFRLWMTCGEDGAFGGACELHEGEQLRCRMQLSNLARDRRVALDRVAARVTHWLAEWQSRDHSGGTDFADL